MIELRNDGFEFERIVDDFVFMCFLVGNDFLPSLPSLSVEDGALDAIIAIYKHILLNYSDYYYLTNEGVIDFTRAGELFLYVGMLE